MKIGIFHDDKKLSLIAQEVANKQFTGMGGLTSTIYEEFGIAIAKKYANSLVEVDFNYVGTFLKLTEIQSNNELMGLYIFREYLNQVVAGFVNFNEVAEFIKSFKNTIDKHFDKLGNEKTIEIQNLISEFIKNNRDKLDNHLQNIPSQLNGMINGFVQS